jgi:hypothetical protein
MRLKAKRATLNSANCISKKIKSCQLMDSSMGALFKIKELMLINLLLWTKLRITQQQAE